MEPTTPRIPSEPCRICGLVGDHGVGCPLKPEEKNPHPCQWCGYVGEHTSNCPVGQAEEKTGGIINMSGIGQETSAPVSGSQGTQETRVSPKEASRAFIKQQLPHLSDERVEELVQKELEKNKK
ncbi:MAG: hypothetical protein AAB560_02090 [Patescibacteria group bacterium]